MSRRPAPRASKAHERIAGQQCEKINPTVPARVAYEIVGMFEIIQGLAARSSSDGLCQDAKLLVAKVMAVPGNSS